MSDKIDIMRQEIEDCFKSFEYIKGGKTRLEHLIHDYPQFALGQDEHLVYHKNDNN
jgi:hypothetical protein